MKQVSEGPKGSGSHGAQLKEGPRGGMHGTQAKEGHKATGKSNHPEASLRSGSLPGANNSLSGHGLREGQDKAPTGESNHETLRHGSKPSAERVQGHAKHNHETLKRARMLNVRSEKGGAEKGGGW